VAWAEIRIAQHLQQFVRTVAAANDARGIESKGRPYCLAQNPSAAFGILLKVLLRFHISRHRRRAWTERVLVGRELVDLRHTRRARPAADIRRDVQDTGLRTGLLGRAHWVSNLLLGSFFGGAFISAGALKSKAEQAFIDRGAGQP